MSFLNPIEELVNYIISHIHEGLLLNRLDSQQLKANIAEGIYILQDIEFNTKSINQNLPDSLLHVSSAKAGKMNLMIPSLLKIFDVPVKIRFTNLEINLCSAKSSGCSVVVPILEPFTENDGSPGLNLLTKSIGKFLSSINAEICLLTINIFHNQNYLQISIPKLSYKENSGIKTFKIEGISVNLNKNPQFTLCAIEKDIEGTINIDTSAIEITSIIDKILFCLDFDQLLIINQILNGLEKSDLVQDASSELVKTLQSIENKIQFTPIKTKAIKFKLEKLDIILLSSPYDFEKPLNYNPSLHDIIKSPHFHLSFDQIFFDLGTGKSSILKYHLESSFVFSIESIFLNYYHFTNKVLSESTELFKSAYDTFFPDFFRIPSNINSISDNYCLKQVLSFDKKNGENTLQVSEDSEAVQIHLSAATLSLNCIVLDEIIKLTRNWKFGTTQAENTQEKNIVIDCPNIKIEYGTEQKECWCIKENSKILLNLEKINKTIEKNTLISINTISLFFQEHDQVYKIMDLCTFMTQTNKKTLVTENKKNKNYYSYFDSSQGFVTLSKNKSAEPKQKHEIFDLSKEEVKEEIKGESNISIVSITSFYFDFDVDLYKKLSSIYFPSIPKSQSDSQLILNIQFTKLNFEKIQLEAESLTIINFSNTYSCEIRVFTLTALECYKSYDLNIKIANTDDSTNLSIKNLVLSYPQVQSFMEISQRLSNANSNSIKIFTVDLENIFFLLPADDKAYFTFVISEAQATIILCGNISLKIYLGLAHILLSQNEFSNPKVSWENFSSTENTILATVSCIDVRLTYAPGQGGENCSFGGNCLQYFDDFYICEIKNRTNYIINFTCVIGNVNVHICKDTVQTLLESLTTSHENSDNEEIKISDDSCYYDFDSSESIPCKVVHLHSFPNKIFPSASISVCSFFVSLYSGFDFPKPDETRKSILDRIVIKFQELDILYTIQNEYWSLSTKLENFEVINLLNVSEVKKVVCKDIKKESKSPILSVDLKGLNSLFCSNQLEIQIDISPLKVNMDQYFLEFCFEWGKEEQSDTPILLKESIQVSNSRVKHVLISPVSISLDYIATAPSLYILKIEDFLISLPKFEVNWCSSIEEATEKIWNYWLDYIKNQKFIAFIGTLSPFVSISNIASAIIGLIKKPLDSQSPIEGAKQGLLGLIKVFSLEGLRLCDTVIVSLSIIFQRLGKFERPGYNPKFSRKFKRLLKYVQADPKQLEEDTNKFKY